jgi:hypothetical protein
MRGRVGGEIRTCVAGALTLILLVACWCWSACQSEVILLPDGKAEFHRGGLFHRDRFRLEHRGHTWHFWSFPASGRPDGGELILPFECPYNEYRMLRIESNGKVYLLDKQKMTREELRVVDGQWSYDADDHWQSIFDLDVY